ncbi:glycerol-3-phosphate 1-O-acyltransferase PlsY [Brackiella oedipodis]|uniref:glycerol-3-phosphate 1-O-acyltransferase PlsY n=1 Tax=Brackiella oedipodis TaxID=124225 RepID=UPI00068806C0|nr:glycerol-3-phosphate 1-O-acyltransferase PlsY [Brackiella oedipodis]
MNSILLGLLVAVFAYLLGSIPFAIVFSKLFKLQDPRTYGSGNPGATNVLRSGHKGAAALTLLFDAFKGWLAVYIARYILITRDFDMEWIAFAAIMVFAGHVYPLFTRFKGGKGVATAVGVLLLMNPLIAMVAILIWLFTAIVFHYSSLAAIVAAIASPICYLVLSIWTGTWVPQYFVALLIITSWLIYNHKQNIRNLRNGTESKIGQKSLKPVLNPNEVEP